MPTKLPDFVNEAVLLHFDDLEIDKFHSVRFLCKYLAFKFKISPEHAYKLVKDKIEHCNVFGYVPRSEVKPEIAKFILRHRKGAVRWILGRAYIREDIILPVKKKLGVR